MSAVIEAMAGKEGEEESAAKSASEKLLMLCRGAKKKVVGMIGLNLPGSDLVTLLPKPSFKSVLMLPRRGVEAQEYKAVNRRKKGERCGRKRK